MICERCKRFVKRVNVYGLCLRCTEAAMLRMSLDRAIKALTGHR